MSGRKRSRDDCYEELMLKIRRLEKEVMKKSRRKVWSSSEYESDEDFSQYDDVPIEQVEDASLVEAVSVSDVPRAPPAPAPPAAAESPPASPAPAPASPAPAPASPVLPGPRRVEAENDPADLDQEILEILGDDPSVEKSFGEDLHKDIASRWKYILVNGLDKEKRTALLKSYLPSENCPSMKAPKLNPEIKAALTEIKNKKDIYSQSKQSQLTSCLAAVGKALTMALNKKNNISQEIIKTLSDAGRLICDYHHKESVSRRYSAMNTLTKSTKDTIKNTKIDEFLFGSDLAEQLKSSKAISKSGSEMRPPAAAASGLRNKPPSTTTAAAARRAPALNAREVRRAPAPAAEPRAQPAPRRPQPRHAPRAREAPRYRSRRT